MNRFARLLNSPVSSCQIIIIIIGLPHQRRISRLSHPSQDAGCIVPYMMLETFVHRLVHFYIHQLGFPTEIFDSLSFSIIILHRREIFVRSRITSGVTKEMFIPHFIARPPVLFGNKFLEAFESSENCRTNFRTKSPPSGDISTIPIRSFRKIPVRMRIHPGAATGKPIAVRIGMVCPIPSIVNIHIFFQPFIEWG